MRYAYKYNKVYKRIIATDTNPMAYMLINNKEMSYIRNFLHWFLYIDCENTIYMYFSYTKSLYRISILFVFCMTINCKDYYWVLCKQGLSYINYILKHALHRTFLLRYGTLLQWQAYYISVIQYSISFLKNMNVWIIHDVNEYQFVTIKVHIILSVMNMFYCCPIKYRHVCLSILWICNHLNFKTACIILTWYFVSFIYVVSYCYSVCVCDDFKQTYYCYDVLK